MSSTNIIKKAYADTPHGQIHYRYALPQPETPKQKIPLIFLHKSASSSASYDALISIYSSRGYACYAPDMPGFGSSFDPSPAAILEIEAQGTAWYCSLFKSVFDSLGLPKAHIIGHHSGACLAVEFAVSSPEFVASICLVGPTVMSAEERAAMKEIYFKPFNEPVPDGSHLAKTWEYLGNMGVGGDLGLWQREVIDHVRAWRGRNLIYGAVWAQDAEKLYMEVKCGILLMCARDDVLWKFFGHVKGMRTEVRAVEIQGGNFELDRDFGGIERAWTGFLGEVEGKL